MSIRKEEAYNYVLCFELTESRLKYGVVARSSGKVVSSKTVELTAYSREAITPILEEEWLTYDYDSYVAAVGGKRNTLIPVDLFNHSKASEIFKLNYSEPIDNLDYNRIPELGIVTIYELPLWVKSMLVIKFPRMRFTHPSTVLLKGVFDGDCWGPKIHIYIQPGSFFLLITVKNKLEYFNRFDYNNLADLVYHVLFVLEQKEMEQSKMEINLYGVDLDWDMLNELKTLVKCPVKVSDAPEMAGDFILSKQLLCV